MRRTILIAALSVVILPAHSSSAEERGFRTDIEDQSVAAYIRELSETKPVPTTPGANTLSGLLIAPAAAAAAAATMASVRDGVTENHIAMDGYEDR
jgi:hypothetical protein